MIIIRYKEFCNLTFSEKPKVKCNKFKGISAFHIKYKEKIQKHQAVKTAEINFDQTIQT